MTVLIKKQMVYVREDGTVVEATITKDMGGGRVELQINGTETKLEAQFSDELTPNHWSWSQGKK